MFLLNGICWFRLPFQFKINGAFISTCCTFSQAYTPVGCHTHVAINVDIKLNWCDLIVFILIHNIINSKCFKHMGLGDSLMLHIPA